MNRRGCWAWWCVLMLVGCPGPDPVPPPDVLTDAGADGGLTADTGGSCGGRVCGSSSAGEFCGSCTAPSVCNAAGQCQAMICVPACGTNDCGADPGLNCTRQFCGNLGGGCPTGLTCVRGHCTCAPNCTGRTCGPDGCGGTCAPGCGRGFQCGGSGSCEVNPASSWVVTVTRGTVAERNSTGATWDSLGGAPDPFVCLTISGRQTCTPEVTDTFAPVWNFALPAVTALSLQTAFVVSYSERDVVGAESICDALSLPIDLPTFIAGGTTVSCRNGSWSFTLRAQ